MHTTYLRTAALALLLLVSVLPAVALQWSEMLFNPAGNDNGKEFIELAGNESLEGCVVADSASKDILRLLQNGTGIILIVEDNATVDLGNATAYSAGSAIGNGLGNSADSVAIYCNNETVLSMAYNISAMAGYKEGYSIVFNASDGTWSISQNTPGVLPEAPHDPPPEGNGSADPPRCNDTLIIALNTVSAEPGERISVEIISAGYASFDITADGLPFSSGDTLTTRMHGFAAPNAQEMKIVASAQECGAQQRAVRYLRIRDGTTRSRQSEVTPVAAAPAAPPPEQPPAPQRAMPAAPSAEAAVQEIQVPVMQIQETPPQEVMDDDANAVPWIAAFGIVTVAASTLVFLQLLRRGQA